MTASPAEQGGRPAGRDLRAATIVGAGLLALLAVAVAGPPWALAALVLVLFAAAFVETGGVLAAAARPVDVGVLLTVAVLGIAGALLADAAGLLAALVLLPVLALLRGVQRGGGSGTLEVAARTVLLGMWVVGLGGHAVLLRGSTAGAAGLVAVVAAVAVSDTAAYAVGSAVGRRPLAPRLSPNKTWEGVVGGLVAAGAVGAWALPALGLSGGALGGTVIAVTVAVAGTLGDLVESMIKRDVGVKDLGRLLPGHGGVLDRVDALLFALPVGHHLFVLLG